MGMFSDWFEKNYRKLLITVLLWLAIIYTVNTAIELKEYSSFKDIARSEIRHWLSTHNINVTVVNQTDHTIVMSKSVFDAYQQLITLLVVITLGTVIMGIIIKG